MIESDISVKASDVLKSKLEDVSIDFSTYDMSNTLMDSDSDRSTSSEKNASVIMESTDLSTSLSSSHGSQSNFEAGLATKQLLMKILSFPVSNSPTGVLAHSNQAMVKRLENPYAVADDNSYVQMSDVHQRSSFQSVPVEGSLPAVSSEIERLTDMLKDRRSQFRDLTISDAMLHDLQLKSETELSIHELACLRSAEYSLPLKRDLEKARKDLAIANHRLQESLHSSETLSEEIERLKRVSAAAREGDRVEKVALEARCVRGSELMEAEILLRRQVESKAAKHDRLEAEYNRLVIENSDLRTTLQQQSSALDVLQSSERATSTFISDAHRERDLLVIDKQFLQSELRNSELKYDEKSRENEGNKSRRNALEDKVAQMTDQLLSMQTTARNDFDIKMEKEILRLREDSHVEMESIKAASRDLADRENRVLREAKASLEMEAELLRRRLHTLSEQHSALIQEHSLQQTEKNKVISELRADFKMKSFELTALGAAFEDRMSRLRQAELEAEMDRGEVAAHRTAFQRLESESTAQLTRMRSTLEEAEKRILNYEKMEEMDNEIDDDFFPQGNRTTMMAGEIKRQIEVSGKMNGNSDGGFFEIIKRIPSRTVEEKIRKRQLLVMFERSRRELEASHARIEVCNREIESLRRDLALVKQPKHYLIAKLRDEEEAKKDAVDKLHMSEGAVKEGADMLAEKEIEVGELRERLCVLLESRGELQQLKELLASLEEDSGEGDSQGGRQTIRGRDTELNEDEEEAEEEEEEAESDARNDNYRDSDDAGVEVVLQGRQGDGHTTKDGPGLIAASCELTAPAVPVERVGGVMENLDRSFPAAGGPPTSSDIPSNPPEPEPLSPHSHAHTVRDLAPSPSPNSQVPPRDHASPSPVTDRHVSAVAPQPVFLPVPVSLEGISASTLTALLTPPKKQSTDTSPAPAPSSSFSSPRPLDSRSENREGSPAEGPAKTNSRWHTRELL